MIDMEGSLACNFCVKQAFHFSIPGSTSSSGNKLHVAQESISPTPFMGQVDMQRQRYWKIGPTKTFVVRLVVYVPSIFPHRNTSQVYKDVMREKRIEGWCRVFANCGTDIHNQDRTVRPTIIIIIIICHGVVPLVDPFRSHVSRILFKCLPGFLLPVGE